MPYLCVFILCTTYVFFWSLSEICITITPFISIFHFRILLVDSWWLWEIYIHAFLSIHCDLFSLWLSQNKTILVVCMWEHYWLNHPCYLWIMIFHLVPMLDIYILLRARLNWVLFHGACFFIGISGIHVWEFQMLEFLNAVGFCHYGIPCFIWARIPVLTISCILNSIYALFRSLLEILNGITPMFHCGRW